MDQLTEQATDAAVIASAPIASSAYDVFLSYSRADSQIAAEINHVLSGAGLKVFFDRAALPAGLSWMRRLEKSIGESRSAVILVGPTGFGNTQQYERELALIRHAKERDSFRVIPVLLPGIVDPPASFLDSLTWVDLRELDEAGGEDERRRRLLKALVDAVVAGATETASLRDTLCPYRGLDSFREEDAALFFGRGSVNEANTPLGELARKVQELNFVAVVGRSGSGKSSLVFAGLLPALRQRRNQFWDIVTLRPGANPLRALAECFNPRKPDEGPAAYIERISTEANALRGDDPEQLKHLAEHHLKTDGKGNERLLIYVDQWEELYAQAPRPEEKDRLEKHRADVERFITLLVSAAELRPDRPPTATVIISVRADFYDHLIRHKQLGRILPRQQVNIGAMSRDDLRRTIVQPAALVGLAFEPPTLVNKILEETGQDEGMLPLLQYALKETWANRDGKHLTAAAYERSGGVKGAIIKTADKAFETLSTDEQRSASQLFLRLVSPGEGQEDSRIRAIKPSDSAQQRIVEQFSGPRTRLLVTGSDGSGRGTVEVAHEALIRTWPRLRTWIDENRGKLRARAAILQSKREWETNGCRRDLLLRSGYQLERARELLKDPGDVSVEDINEYIDLSKRREDRARLLKYVVVAILALSAAAGVAASIAIWVLFHQAQTNLRAGTNALSVLTDVIDKEVLPAARVAEVNELLSAAQNAVKQFPAEAASDPGVALELARLKLTSADLEKLRKLGNASTILTGATAAAAALKAIVEADQRDLGAQYELAHADILIGRVLADYKPADAEPRFRSAIDRLAALADQNAGNAARPYWVQELTTAEEYLGDLLIDKLGRIDEAKSVYDRARGRLEELQRANQQIHGLDRDIAWAINKQGDIQLRSRDPASALKTYDDARGRLKQIEQAGHLWDDANWVYTLVIIDNNIALLQRDVGDYDASIETLKEAYADADELVHHHDPDNLWWRGTLGWTLDNEGWVYFLSANGDRARLELARETLLEASRIRNDLLSGANRDTGSEPQGNPLWQSDANFTASNLDVVIATEMDMAGDHCGAAQKFVDAAVLNNETTPGDVEGRALRSMQILDWSATAYRAAGDQPDAQRELGDAMAIAQKYLATTRLQTLKDEASAIQKKLAEINAMPAAGQCRASGNP